MPAERTQPPAGPPLEAGELLRRQARRLQWGLTLYLLLLLLIGIGVLRLALTARQFDHLTVTPVASPPEDSGTAAAVPVSGAVP